MLGLIGGRTHTERTRADPWHRGRRRVRDGEFWGKCPRQVVRMDEREGGMLWGLAMKSHECGGRYYDINAPIPSIFIGWGLTRHQNQLRTTKIKFAPIATPKVRRWLPCISSSIRWAVCCEPSPVSLLLGDVLHVARSRSVLVSYPPRRTCCSEVLLNSGSSFLRKAADNHPSSEPCSVVSRTGLAGGR